MALAIAILAVAALLAGFLTLTSLEAKSGKRLFASSREKLDARAGKLFEVAREVDLGKLVFHALHAAVDYVVHEAVHIILFAVRILERTLTRAARYLRGRRADETSDPRKPLSESLEKIKQVLKKEEAQ